MTAGYGRRRRCHRLAAWIWCLGDANHLCQAWMHQRWVAPIRKNSKTTTTTTTTTALAFWPSQPAPSNAFRSSVTSVVTSAAPLEAMDLNDRLLSQLASPPVLLLVALTLGILANGWIQSLLSGEQGLGSFLSDGRGFNKSNFNPRLRDDADRAVQSDPLPWLRLPDFDFVEVAGETQRKREMFERGRSTAGVPQQQQDDDDDAVIKLELLRLKMQEQLVLGNVDEATALRVQLERAMRESGVQFLKDDD